LAELPEREEIPDEVHLDYRRFINEKSSQTETSAERLHAESAATEVPPRQSETIQALRAVVIYPREGDTIPDQEATGMVSMP
jgi:hypothetical protein